MTDTVKSWIEERRAIHTEATEDTARVLWEHNDHEGESPNENFDSEPKWEQERLNKTAQAVLESSDAHNMFPRALDALNAVLEEHKTMPNSSSALFPTPACTCGENYPCPTVQAIEGAINE